MLSLKKLERLVAEKVEFRLEGEVVSEETIDARKLVIEDLSTMSSVLNFLGGVCLFALCCSLMIVMMAMLRYLLAGNPAAIAGSIAICVPLTVCYFMFHRYLERLAALEAEIAGFAPLEQVDCEVMLAACKATPEGRAYRERVVAMGRQFVEAEKKLLEDWAEGARSRAKCAELYSLESKA